MKRVQRIRVQGLSLSQRCSREGGSAHGTSLPPPFSRRGSPEHLYIPFRTHSRLPYNTTVTPFTSFSLAFIYHRLLRLHIPLPSGENYGHLNFHNHKNKQKKLPTCSETILITTSFLWWSKCIQNLSTAANHSQSILFCMNVSKKDEELQS